MKNFVVKNIKPILLILSIIVGVYIIYSVFDTYSENRIEKRIKEERAKIEILKQEAVFWKTKSEMFENESRNYKQIVENSKQNITNIVNKYDEERTSVTSLNDDESIKFLAKRLNQKSNSK